MSSDAVAPTRLYVKGVVQSYKRYVAREFYTPASQAS